MDEIKLPLAMGSESPLEKPAATLNYKKRALESASFVVIGYGISQIVRLFGNVALTRLLVPELFGIITIARVFVTGLSLFSDVGLEPSIIRSQRSNDPVFINTVWTIKIIRSLILAVLSCAIAFPIAAIYKQPILAAVIPAIGFIGIFDGLKSTSLTKLDRDLQQRKITVMDLTIQMASTICMVVVACFFKSVWVLLVYEVISSLIWMTWSHFINAAHPNKFTLEKPAIKEILSFGKWILVSTAMMFMATQTDRMMLGKLFPMAWLGIYNIAITLAEIPKQVISRISSKVIFPLISKYSHFSREELREKIRVPRGKMLYALAMLLSVFSCSGDFIVFILYDQRYSEGAWILPMLAIGMWPLLLVQTIDSSLLSIGKSKYCAMGNLAKFLFMAISIPLGFKFGGKFGAILAITLNDLPSYIIINYGLAKERLSLLKQDAIATLVLSATTGILLLIRILTGLGLPGYSSFLHG